MLIIGDIAGQYKTLLNLLKKCPDQEPISVGDMIDRGPESDKVLNFFMTTKGAEAIKGNHEHFLEDFYFEYDYYEDKGSLWFQQGGIKTLQSFKPDLTDGDYTLESLKAIIPENIAYWIKALPLYKKQDGFLISHAPLRKFMTLEQCCDLGPEMAVRTQYGRGFRDYTILWNREYPAKVDDYFQIFGHCSEFGCMKFDDYAICLDSSRQHKITAIEIPSMKIYEQGYV